MASVRDEIKKLKERIADLEEMVEYLDERCQQYRDFLDEIGFIEEFDEAHGDDDD